MKAWNIFEGAAIAVLFAVTQQGLVNPKLAAWLGIAGIALKAIDMGLTGTIPVPLPTPKPLTPAAPPATIAPAVESQPK